MFGPPLFSAPIYWRTDVPLRQKTTLTKHSAPIVFRGFFCVRSAITFGAGGFGAPIVLADYKEDDWVRCAPRLFSCQSPINWALRTGNRNMLQKRQRFHKKINRHWSPRSGTTFEHLLASRPPLFFIGHYLKEVLRREIQGLKV